MNRIISIICVLGTWTLTVFGQSDLKIVQAKIERTYEELSQDEYLHACCKSGPSLRNNQLKASSTLSGSSENDYEVDNLGDDDRNTAWIEGAIGVGKGAFIEFDYAYDSSYEQAAEGAFNYRDEWFLLNGYQKNRTTWQENGRVKRLKLYLNSIAFCYIDLLDQPGVQQINLDFLRFLDKNKGTLKVKLEIVDVYKGERYKDTAISEIFW